jgi:hypothetical protein
VGYQRFQEIRYHHHRLAAVHFILVIVHVQDRRLLLLHPDFGPIRPFRRRFWLAALTKNGTGRAWLVCFAPQLLYTSFRLLDLFKSAFPRLLHVSPLQLRPGSLHHGRQVGNRRHLPGRLNVMKKIIHSG